MKKMKLAAVAAAALMAATTIGTLAGCADKSHTIRVYLLTNNTEREVYTQYFKDLEAEINEELEAQGLQGYKISFSGDETKGYYSKLESDVAQNNTPDIFYLRPNEILQYKKSIVSVQDYVDANPGLLSGVYETAINMYRYNPTTGALGNAADDLYAFPKDLSTQQLGYNKKLLSAYQTEIKELDSHVAGQKMKMPWEMNFNVENYSWDDYLKINEAISKAPAPDGVNGTVVGCDIPSVEILAHSYAVAAGIDDYSLVDLNDGRANGKVSSIDEGTPLYKAIEYQAKLAASGGADYQAATSANFGAGTVCFYGEIGSWEVAERNEAFGEGNWEVMPWPTVDGSVNWYGLIKSAGYVISKDCAKYEEKAEIAMRIASSFLSATTQDLLVKEKKITLPILTAMKEDYLDSANDNVYSPKSRKIFIDVISGDHGFFPAEYSTYNTKWLDELTTPLADMWTTRSGAIAAFGNMKLNDIQQKMQQQYDAYKNR